LSSSPSSSVPFTPCGAEGIHEELPSVAISSYPPDLIPWSSCICYFILYNCPSLRSLWPTSSSVSLRIPIQCSIAPASLRNVCRIQFHLKFVVPVWKSFTGLNFLEYVLHSSKLHWILRMRTYVEATFFPMYAKMVYIVVLA
jgi:hypothetical protein